MNTVSKAAVRCRSAVLPYWKTISCGCAAVGAPNGSQMVVGERRGPREHAEQMGISLAEELLDGGARDILREVYQGQPPA